MISPVSFSMVISSAALMLLSNGFNKPKQKPNIVFDGHWRFHSQDSSLYDCLNLPMEKLADMSEKEAQEAYDRLLGIWDSLNYSH